MQEPSPGSTPDFSASVGSPHAVAEADEATRDKSERDLDALQGGAGGGGGGGGGGGESPGPSLPPADAGSSLADLLRAGEELAEARKLEQVKRGVELARVPVAAADVEFLVREFELEKGAAERVLRAAGGDVKAVARRLAGLPPQ
jgi:hypothetical protein